MRYRSKPVEITAEQFLEGHPLPKGVRKDYLTGEHFVTTVHGQKTWVVYGDYIVPEPKEGCYYPVKPEIFENRWELIGV